jgi:hypothetical protein
VRPGGRRCYRRDVPSEDRGLPRPRARLGHLERDSDIAGACGCHCLPVHVSRLGVADEARACAHTPTRPSSGGAASDQLVTIHACMVMAARDQLVTIHACMVMAARDQLVTIHACMAMAARDRMPARRPPAETRGSAVCFVGLGETCGLGAWTRAPGPRRAPHPQGVRLCYGRVRGEALLWAGAGGGITGSVVAIARPCNGSVILGLPRGPPVTGPEEARAPAPASVAHGLRPGPAHGHHGQTRASWSNTGVVVKLQNSRLQARPGRPRTRPGRRRDCYAVGSGGGGGTPTKPSRPRVAARSSSTVAAEFSSSSPPPAPSPPGPAQSQASPAAAHSPRHSSAPPSATLRRSCEPSASDAHAHAHGDGHGPPPVQTPSGPAARRMAPPPSQSRNAVLQHYQSVPRSVARASFARQPIPIKRGHGRAPRAQRSRDSKGGKGAPRHALTRTRTVSEAPSTAPRRQRVRDVGPAHSAARGLDSVDCLHVHPPILRATDRSWGGWVGGWVGDLNVAWEGRGQEPGGVI